MIGSSVPDVYNMSVFVPKVFIVAWLWHKMSHSSSNDYLSASAISWMTNYCNPIPSYLPLSLCLLMVVLRPSTSWFFFLNFCFGESWYTVITIVIVFFSFAAFILWFVWLCYIRRCLFFLCRPTFLGWSSTAHRKRASCCRRTPLHDKWPFWPFCIVLLLINTDESTIFVVHNNKNMIEWKYDD